MPVEVKEELVELRRRYGGARQYCMRLAAVVDLVLEEVREERVGALPGRAHHAAVNHDPAIEVRRPQPVAEAD